MKKKPKKEVSQKWLVTVNLDHDLTEVVKELKTRGLKKVTVMEAIGCISGSAPETALEKLKSVNGVIDVSPDQEIQLPPSDSELTW